jgi:hypothetical protein
MCYATSHRAGSFNFNLREKIRAGMRYRYTVFARLNVALSVNKNTVKIPI